MASAGTWGATGGGAAAVHAPTHIKGGSDVIDGDKVDITFVPSEYTRNTTPAEVDNVEHLTAHLKGIDKLLGSVSPVIINTISTIDATVTIITTVPIPDNTAMTVTANVTAIRTNGSDRASYSRRALVFREGGGPATFQGPVDAFFTRESTGAWTASFAVSGNDLIIRVRGIAGSDIDWSSAHIQNSIS